MKTRSLISVCLLIALSVVMYTPIALADSYTGLQYSFYVKYNGEGGSWLPWRVWEKEWVDIDGTNSGNNLNITFFSVSGAITPANSSYPFDDSAVHLRSTIKKNGTAVRTFQQNELTYFQIMIPVDWEPWVNYGKKTGLNLNLTGTTSGTTVVESWWHSPDTLPNNEYPVKTHTFWNSSGWNNYN